MTIQNKNCKLFLFFTALLLMIAVAVGCSSGNGEFVTYLTSDDAGNTYVAWRMVRSVGDHDVHLKKINPAGEILWDKMLLKGDNRRVNISGMASSANGGVFIGWEVSVPIKDKKGRHIYDKNTVVNVDTDGNTRFTLDYSQRIRMIPGDSGGLLLVRYDESNLIVEKLGENGITSWASNLPSGKYQWQFLANSAGETFVLMQNSDNANMSVQKIDAAGNYAWGTAEGIQISNTKTIDDALVVSDNKGGVIIFGLMPPGAGMTVDIGGYRIDSGGTLEFDTSVCKLRIPSNGNIRAVAGDSGETIIIWEDHSSGTALFAQKIDGEGKPLWPENGVPVCTQLPTYSPRFEAVSDGLGGAIIVWRDGNSYLCAQRLDASGNQVWGEEGIQIAENAGDIQVLLTGDNEHGFTIGWRGGGNEIHPDKSYISMITIDGTLLHTIRIQK